jgi:hypothetical protein
MWPKALVTALLLGLAAPAPAAGVYKWVDEQGRVHYGDRPRSVDNASAIGIEAPPPVDAGASERARRRDKLLDAIAQERAEREAREHRLASERREHAQICQRARQQLARYERSNLLYRKDKDGERQYFSDAERASHINTLREATARACRSR